MIPRPPPQSLSLALKEMNQHVNSNEPQHRRHLQEVTVTTRTDDAVRHHERTGDDISHGNDDGNKKVATARIVPTSDPNTSVSSHAHDDAQAHADEHQRGIANARIDAILNEGRVFPPSASVAADCADDRKEKMQSTQGSGDRLSPMPAYTYIGVHTKTQQESQHGAMNDDAEGAEEESEGEEEESEGEEEGVFELDHLPDNGDGEDSGEEYAYEMVSKRGVNSNHYHTYTNSYAYDDNSMYMAHVNAGTVNPYDIMDSDHDNDDQDEDEDESDYDGEEYQSQYIPPIPSI